MLQPLPGLAALCKSSPYCNSTSWERAFALFTDGQRTQENPAPWWRQDLDHAAELCGLHRLPPHSGSDHTAREGMAEQTVRPHLPFQSQSLPAPHLSPRGSASFQVQFKSWARFDFQFLQYISFNFSGFWLKISYTFLLLHWSVYTSLIRVLSYLDSLTMALLPTPASKGNAAIFI